MDAGNLRLRARHPQSHQGVCADAIATLENIPREALDDLSLESQKRADRAIRNGHFTKSLVPVHHEDGTLALDREEFPRPQTTREGLAALKPAFQAMADAPLDESGTTYRRLITQNYPDLKIKYVHHAGTSSGVVDGAAAMLLASPDYAKKQGLKPRAHVVAMANMGDSPTLMLNAPVPAARKVLDKAGLTLDDIDLFEINEAFAVVAEKFIRDLEARPRQGERERRRHRARPSDRRDRLDPDRHAARRTGAARSETRAGHDVRRGRHGAGHHHRADVAGIGRGEIPLCSSYPVGGCGIASSRSRVYCASGANSTRSGGPARRSCCRITMTRSHKSRTTLRSCDTKR